MVNSFVLHALSGEFHIHHIRFLQPLCKKARAITSSCLLNQLKENRTLLKDTSFTRKEVEVYKIGKFRFTGC